MSTRNNNKQVDNQDLVANNPHKRMTQRTYVGSVGPFGSKVIDVNGDVQAVGRLTRLPSGASLTMQADGAWVYDPDVALADLRSGEKAIDTFTCGIRWQDKVVRETVSVTLFHKETAEMVLLDHSPEMREKMSVPSDPVKLLVKAATHQTVTFDIRDVVGKRPDNSQAVLILEQSPDGTACVTETGEIEFRPHSGFSGSTSLKCLVETMTRVACFVDVVLEVRAPVCFQVDRLNRCGSTASDLPSLEQRGGQLSPVQSPSETRVEQGTVPNDATVRKFVALRTRVAFSGHAPPGSRVRGQVRDATNRIVFDGESFSDVGGFWQLRIGGLDLHQSYQIAFTCPQDSFGYFALDPSDANACRIL